MRKITKTDINLYVGGAEREITRLHERFRNVLNEGYFSVKVSYLFDVLEKEREIWKRYRNEELKKV